MQSSRLCPHHRRSSLGSHLLDQGLTVVHAWDKTFRPVEVTVWTLSRRLWHLAIRGKAGQYRNAPGNKTSHSPQQRSSSNTTHCEGVSQESDAWWCGGHSDRDPLEVFDRAGEKVCPQSPPQVHNMPQVSRKAICTTSCSTTAFLQSK